MDKKNVWRKTGFGILFVATCFAAMYILMEFHENTVIVALAAGLLLITAFLFLHAVFSDKAKKAVEQEEEAILPEMFSGNEGGVFQTRVSNYMKEMENSQKELISVLKNQNTLLQSQIENLEHEIYMLSEKQVNQTKSVIKFNKENARQLAISERETLEYVMAELKKTIEDNAGAAPARETFREEPVMPEFSAAAPVMELEEISGEEFVEVSELPSDEEFVVPEMSAPQEKEPSLEDLFPAANQTEELEIPELPEDIDLTKLFDMNLFEESQGPEEKPAAEAVSMPEVDDLLAAMEEAAAASMIEEIPMPVVEEPIPVVEEPAPVVEEKAEEPAQAADPLAGLGGDPNAMMTPEDIAKLLAAMGQ